MIKYVGLVALLLCGCGGSDQAESTERFIIIFKERSPYYLSRYILQDNETGQQYIVLTSSNGGIAMTPLLKGDK